MNNPRPSRAAGWISIPVRNRETCEVKRARVSQPACHRRWPTRYMASACTPGQQSATSMAERAAGSRSRTTRTSARKVSNIAVLPPEVVERSRAQGAGDDVRRVLAVIGQALQHPLDLLRLEVRQVFDGASGDQLAGGAGRRDRRAAAIRLEPHVHRPSHAHAQIEASEVSAALVLVLPHPVGFTHQPRVAGVEEVVDEDRAVPHKVPVTAGAGVARQAGDASLSLRTMGSIDAIT